MKLELNGIEVACVIGERPDERLRLQTLRVDLALEVDDAAARSDRLEDAVDYARLTGDVREALVAAKCRMIERAALVVAQVAARLAHVRRVSARVTKSGSVPGLASASATFELACGEGDRP